MPTSLPTEQHAIAFPFRLMSGHGTRLDGKETVSRAERWR